MHTCILTFFYSIIIFNLQLIMYAEDQLVVLTIFIIIFHFNNGGVAKFLGLLTKNHLTLIIVSSILSGTLDSFI